MPYPYQAWTYLWPPRPQTTTSPDSTLFTSMSNDGDYIAELKFKGTRCIIVIDNGKIEFWNRHKEKQRWQAPKEVVDDLMKIFQSEKLIVLDGELMHDKCKVFKNKLYVWDILVNNSVAMAGTTYVERRAMLNSYIKQTNDVGTHSEITSNVWVANIISGDYCNVWNKYINLDFIEGFVWKNIKSKLKPCISEKSSGDWMIRCRKKSASYQF